MYVLSYNTPKDPTDLFRRKHFLNIDQLLDEYARLFYENGKNFEVYKKVEHTSPENLRELLKEG